MDTFELKNPDLIDDRDRAQDAADKLADALAVLLGVDVGKHSNMNDPWQNALIAAEQVIARSIGWLIWSREHDAWWKPNESGYTTDMMCAGRYQRDKADRIAGVRTMHDGSPGEVVVAAPELSLIAEPNLMEKMRGRISAATRAATKRHTATGPKAMSGCTDRG